MKQVPTIRIAKKQKSYTKTKLYVFGFLAIVLLLIAIFATYLTPYDPYLQNPNLALQAPSSTHLAGTDRFGRDLFSRLLVGLSTSVLSTLSLVAIISIFGTMIGICCGYFGGKLDAFCMRIADICLAFPGLVFALAIAAVLQGGLQNAVLALAVISWPKYARIARSQTLTLLNAPFIMAAKLAGNTSWQTISRHIIPNAIGPVLITAMLDIGTMMMELAGLSFLGLGALPPTAELGSMMSGSRSMLQTHPWVILAPGVVICISVIIFNLLGDAIRDYLDPNSMYK